MRTPLRCGSAFGLCRPRIRVTRWDRCHNPLGSLTDTRRAAVVRWERAAFDSPLDTGGVGAQDPQLQRTPVPLGDHPTHGPAQAGAVPPAE